MNVIDAYYHALARVVPGTAFARSKILNKTLHGIVYQHVRKPRLGLFQADELLGWSHRPAYTAVHPSFEFRATYTTDRDGRRVSHYAGSHAQVLMLGCSWAFGHGVDDDDAAAARMTTAFDVPTYNLACMGYGPAQSYLMLTHRIALEDLTASDAVVAYVWTPDQLIRAWRRREWVELNAWVNRHRPSHPVFDIDGGQLRHVGLIGSVDAVTDPLLLPGLTERLEWRITLALIDAMAELVARTGRSFLVVIPPVPPGGRAQVLGRQMRTLLAEHRVPFLDLDNPKSHQGTRGPLFYRFDGHPTRYWHAILAETLAHHRKNAVPDGAGEPT
jgi:hypothetical protein